VASSARRLFLHSFYTEAEGTTVLRNVGYSLNDKASYAGRLLTVTANNFGIFLNYFHKPVAVTLHRYDNSNPPHTGKDQSSLTYTTSADTNWLVGVSGTTQCYIYSNSPDGSSAHILRCSDWTTTDNDSKLAIL
jgi:hypothetical protein